MANIPGAPFDPNFDPATEDYSNYVTGTLDCSFDELMDALRANGSEVQVVLLDTDAGTVKPVAND